jgi:SAM-dependent methyltransferase
MDITSLLTALEIVGARMPSDLSIAEDPDGDPPGWALYFHERGQTEIVARFPTEDAACTEMWRITTGGAPVPPLVDVTHPAERREYWEGPGSAKTFTHPLDQTWLSDLDPDKPVLDYGCGYGRTLLQLSEWGFTDLSGADISWPMIRRARQALPKARIVPLGRTPRLLFDDGRFSLVVLFAVLTCIPDDAAQSAVIAELARVLAPGGILVVSDLIQRDDPASAARYAAGRERFGIDGVFATSDGAIVRHHTPAHLRGLLEAAGLVVARERTIEVATMNGNTATALQLLARSGVAEAGTSPQL